MLLFYYQFNSSRHTTEGIFGVFKGATVFAVIVVPIRFFLRQNRQRYLSVIVEFQSPIPNYALPSLVNPYPNFWIPSALLGMITQFPNCLVP
jgi:hypothetical protein